MNQEIKQQWIAALRSGEYEQTSWTLCRIANDKKNSYCCLGVLCELAVKADVTEFRDTEGRRLFGNCANTQPKSVSQWLGISKSCIAFVVNDFLYNLLVKRNPNNFGDDCYKIGTRVDANDLNDLLNLSFNDIADVLENCEVQ